MARPPFGAEAQAIANQATAVGFRAQAVASATVAVGNGAVANVQGATAMGVFSFAIGDGAAAYGLVSNAAAANTTAVGSQARALAANASAFGENAEASFDNSVAFGHDVTTSRADQQMFGTESNTYTMTGIASAASATAQGTPTRLVTSNETGDLAARTALELGLATSTDITELQEKTSDNTSSIQDNSSAIQNNTSAIQNNSAAIGRNRQDIETNREGVAVAMTLDAPYINVEQSFAVGGNWANFEDENALGFMLAGRVTKFGTTGTFDVSGGVGFGLQQDSVGGRLGGQVAW